MDTSLLVAKCAAIIYLSFGFGMLLQPSYYKATLQELITSKTFLVMGSLLAIVLGVVLIAYHNVWQANWLISITIIGWISLFKGVFILALPEVYLKISKKIFTPKSIKWLTILVLAVGLFFLYFGFFNY